MSENGSTGRFERMEAKLDVLLVDLGTFKVDVVQRLTRLETAQGANAEQDRSEASEKSFRWMKIGIACSFALGLATLIIRING